MMDEIKDVVFKSKKIRNKENQKVINILQLLYMLLKKDEQNLEYYANILECKIPTVKKYFQDIKSSYEPYEHIGFDIKYDKKEKHYELSTDTKFPAFSPEEIEALDLAIGYLDRMEGTPFDNLKEIKKKLTRYSTKKIQEKLNKKIHFSGPEIRSRLNEILDYIDEAINSKKKLVINYSRTYEKETAEKEIFPFSLMTYDYEWYIKAFCFKDEIIKTYCINQISNMELKELTDKERKLLPKDPDLRQAHFWDWEEGNHSDTVLVRVKFIGDIANKMRKKLEYRKEHVSQEIEESNEDLIVTFKVKNPSNMIQWILKFGSAIKVMEPESLIKEFKEKIEEMRFLYKI